MSACDCGICIFCRRAHRMPDKDKNPHIGRRDPLSWDLRSDTSKCNHGQRCKCLVMREQVCVCSHGADWHGGVLAQIAHWEHGEQTDLPCTFGHDFPGVSVDVYDPCVCHGFKLAPHEDSGER